MRSSILLVLLALTALPVAADDALIAHWPMDEADQGVVRDASGNGHDATFHATDGAAPVFARGMVGRAIRLSEAQQTHLIVPWAEEFSFTTPFTVMTWIKPSRRNATFELMCFKGDRSGEPPWPGWRLRFFWARAVLQVGTPEGTEPQVGSAEWSVPAGYWSHVAAGWDGQYLRLYVNAVEKACTPFAGRIAPQSHGRHLVLGNYMGRKDAYAFDGLMDDLKMFGRFLDEEEMLREAHGTTRNASPLTGIQ